MLTEDPNLRPRHSDDDKGVIAAIFERLPELARVTQVRRRDGSLVPFAVERIGAALAQALKDAGLSDEVLLARLTYQVLSQIEREFDGRSIPATEDIDRVIAQVLIENDLPFALKKFLIAKAPRSVPRSGPGLRFARTLIPDPAVSGDLLEAAKASAGTVAAAGRAVGYFAGEDDAAAFADDLARLLASGVAAFSDRQNVLEEGRRAGLTDETLRACVDPRAPGADRAKEALRAVALAAKAHARHAVVFETTVQRWHSVPYSGRASDVSLTTSHADASIDLMRCCRQDGTLDVSMLKRACELLVTALDILIDSADYPTPGAEERSTGTRPIRIAFKNPAAFLAARGIAYDSDAARGIAAVVAGIVTGHCFQQSAKLAEAMGPFRYYKLNERPMLKVIGMHRDRSAALPAGVPEELVMESKRAWDGALEFGLAFGYRNSQVTCADTGPDDAALAVTLKMIAAIQPLLSGVVPAPVVLMADTRVEDVERVIIEAWQLGLRGLDIRGGLEQSVSAAGGSAMPASAAAVPRRLPDERAAVSHRFTIGGREMLLTVGLHPDGAPGELFIRMARPDPTLSGLLDAFAAMTTIALERGASLESLAEACVGSRSEPSGATSNPEIAMATSVIDYVFRWMTARFPAK